MTEPSQAYRDALAAMLAQAQLCVDTLNDQLAVLHAERERLASEAMEANREAA